MIDKKLLMNSIKAETEELANQRVKIHKDCMNNLRDMNYSRVIMDSINLHVIEGGIRIFNDLSEMIEEGNFDLKIQKGENHESEIPINLNEKETDETNIKTLKTYFNKRNKSFEDKKTAAEATNNIILNNNNIRDFWVEWGTIKEGIHKKDILCFFDTDTDEEKFKNLFINYGFILQKSKHGFWIIGVKE